MNRGRNITSTVVLIKTHNLNLIMKKRGTKWGTLPKLRVSPLQKCQDYERKRKAEKLLQVLRNMITKCGMFSWTGFWSRKKKNAVKDNDKFESCLWTRSFYINYFLILTTILPLYKRMSWFFGEIFRYKKDQYVSSFCQIFLNVYTHTKDMCKW